MPSFVVAPSLSVTVVTSHPRCRSTRPTTRRAAQQCYRRGSQVRLSAKQPPSDPSPNSSSSSSPLLARLATAFIDACQPGRKPYAAALHDFCVIALDAYRRGYTLRALDLELAAATGGGARPLLSDEVELRSVWLSLVFKTLRHIGFPSSPSDKEGDSGHRNDLNSSTFMEKGNSDSGVGNDNSIDRNRSNSVKDTSTPPRSISAQAPWERDRMDDFVKNIVNSVRAGYDINRIRLEQNLAQQSDSRTELESAILSQSTRLVVTTLSAADEALRQQNDGTASPPPDRDSN